VSRTPAVGWSASSTGLRYAVSEYARAATDADVSAGTGR
jgi:dihydrofolate reductase